MKNKSVIILINGKIIEVKETFDELDAKINHNNNFIYVTYIIYYTIERLIEKSEEKKMIINKNHIALIEPI